jgi:hypothetical protein
MDFSDDHFALYAGIGQSSIGGSLEINITRPPQSGAFSLLPCDSRLTNNSHQLLDCNKKLYGQHVCSQKHVNHSKPLKYTHKMAPQYMPLPLLGNTYVAVKTANTTFDSPDWNWSQSNNFLEDGYVPYICEAILVILIFT